jgi:multidrug resistance protein MdtO
MTAAELFRDELMLSPARTRRIVRMTVLVALIVILSMALRVPEVAISALMIFFLAKRDVATTVKTAVGGVLGVTLALALCFLCFTLTIGEPAARLPLMVLLAFMGMYLMRATALGPLALLLGFVAFYGQTFPDQVPSPEALVRLQLWIWVVVAYPVALLVLADLAFGSRPAEVYRSGIAERLAAAADFLAPSPEREAKARTHLVRLVRLGANDLLPYVGHGGPPATVTTRASLLRQTELLGFLLRELPDDARHDTALAPALLRAGGACQAARNALIGRGAATQVHFDLLAAERRALATMTPKVRAILLPLVNCIQTIVLSVHQLDTLPKADSAPSHQKPKPPPRDKVEAAQFATKVTLAATIAYLIYSGLEWYSIHTATITCFFVAEDSVGATIHKLTLRLTGALIGATLGILAIIFVLPGLETVGGLVVVVSVVTMLAAWVATGSQRIAYIGTQIALAFYLTVLQGFSRTTKLYVGRDRVIGILLGNILMSVVFTSLWPVRTAPAQRQEGSRMIEALAALLHTSPDDRDALDRAEADFYTHLTKARQYFTPRWFEGARDDRAFLLTVMQGLLIPIHAIARTPAPATASPAARAALSSATQNLSAWLYQYATSIALQSSVPPPPPTDPALVTLEREHLADQIGWLELVHAQCVALAERRST